MNRLRVAMIQVNSVVGGLEGNVARVRSALGEVVDCDVAVFPEMVLTGYPLEDLLFKPSFLRDNVDAMHQIMAASKGIAVVCGYVEMGPDIANAAAIVSGGHFIASYRKTYLPNYGAVPYTHLRPH